LANRNLGGTVASVHIDGGWMGVVKGERELYNATPEAADFALDLLMRNYTEQQAIGDGVLQLGGFEAPARPLGSFSIQKNAPYVHVLV